LKILINLAHNICICTYLLSAFNTLESIADTLRIDYVGKGDESLKKDIDAAIKKIKNTTSKLHF